MITRVAPGRWEALDGDRVAGRGDTSPRPDGRIFVSIDVWHDAVFDQLARAMLSALPTPLYTVVDEADRNRVSAWCRAGFTIRRREWECLVPADPAVTGLGGVLPPPGVTIVAAGEAEENPLRAVDRTIRDEVEAAVGWQEMPAEVMPRRGGDTVVDPSKYAVAAQGDHYFGLIRVVQVTRLPRIGLIAVRADQQRRGIARALLAHSLGALNSDGIIWASTEVNETNTAAIALFENIGARRVSSNLELVLR